MSQRIPAEVFPIGDFLKEEMDARGWNQADLAKIIGRSDRDVHALINGKLALRPETATLLGDAFGTAPEYWMNLDTAYRAWKTSRDMRDAVSRKGRLYELAPVREMQKRGWIPATEDVDALERHVFEFFSVGGRDTLMSVAMPFAARAGVESPADSASVRAWVTRVRNMAPAVTVSRSYSAGAFADCLARLRLLLSEPVEARHVPRVLSEHGIRFVVVEHLQKTRTDGACLWLDANSPVIALSMRYERLDWFWFTLLHEMQHVSARDGLDTGVTDDDLVGKDARDYSTKPTYEQAADRFAANFLVPQSEMDNFIARVSPLYSKDRIRSFSKRINVHPSLVVGQLQFRGEIPYYHSREMLKDKLRRIVQANALTDGWR